MQSSPATILLTLVLISGLGTGSGCMKFDYPDGVYACTMGEDLTCPDGFTCQESSIPGEFRCYSLTSQGDCALGTCTGCCETAEGPCLAGNQNGACGNLGGVCNVCTTENICENGACVPDLCPGIGIFCENFGDCVDPLTDPAHCGTCDNVCQGATPFCVAGECSNDCGSLYGCVGACVNLDRDPINCGDCGTVCAIGEMCLGGDCVCRPGLENCGSGCVDMNSDPESCGECGANACDDSGNSQCSDGVCSGDCSAPTQCSMNGGFACVDEQIHPLHCGVCGVSCNANEVCIQGDCRAFQIVNSCAECEEACCNYPTVDQPICIPGAPNCPQFPL